MLTTYLNNIPYTKFVLIQDTLEERGKNMFHFLLKKHAGTPILSIHYFVCEGNFNKTRGIHTNSVITFHDFVSDTRNWMDTKATKNDFRNVASGIYGNCIIFIDSLAHLFLRYGVSAVYAALNELIQYRTNVQQIIAVLHLDLLADQEQTCHYFENLATLSLVLQPETNHTKARVQFLYKKVGGRVVKEVEEYRFVNGNLVTEPVKKIDTRILVLQNLKQTLPENLTTFKISLDETEKQSRNELILPYLPKAKTEMEPEGNILYQFDDVDDWDEEDPDDDLDI